jgi:hypothetical protein
MTAILIGLIHLTLQICLDYFMKKDLMDILNYGMLAMSLLWKACLRMLRRLTSLLEIGMFLMLPTWNGCFAPLRRLTSR